MAITLRSSREIETIRRAGAVVADVLSKMKEVIKSGVSTGELNDLALEITKSAHAKALFKGVESPYAKDPFPGAICASINEQVVHGIPSHNVKVKEGDILSIDYGVKLAGYCGDAAVTVAVGDISSDKQKLIDVTKKLLDIAIAKSAPGLKWSEIAADMEACSDAAGFSVVKDFVGHGIGTEMHEDPKVPNFVNKDLLKNDILLREGMILAVEPMVNMGSSAVKTMPDGWLVVTKDGKCSAHFEHTIAIVKSGCEVLTA
jgi:methionyl aminopeptidase